MAAANHGVYSYPYIVYGGYSLVGLHRTLEWIRLS